MDENRGCGHEHEHGQGECDCGSEQDGIITLVDDDGVEHEFEIADMMEDENGSYLALIPMLEGADAFTEEEGELVILKIVAEGVEEYLEAIEDEEEFDRVSAIFIERLCEEYDFTQE